MEERSNFLSQQTVNAIEMLLGLHCHYTTKDNCVTYSF